MHGEKGREIGGLLMATWEYLEKFHISQGGRIIKKETVVRSIKWQKSPFGTTKLNLDAFAVKDGDQVWLGVVIKDH